MRRNLSEDALVYQKPRLGPISISVFTILVMEELVRLFVL